MFAVYLGLALLLTSLQLGLAYLSTRDAVTQELKAVANAFEPGLTQALWNYQENQIRAIAQGILSSPVVSAVRITDLHAGIDVNLSSPLHSAQDISTQSSIQYDYLGAKQVIGEFWVYADNRVVLARMRDGVLLIVIAALIKTLGLLWIVQYFVRRMLVRPLAAFTAHLARFDAASDLTPIDTRIVSTLELKRLMRSFNRLIFRLQKNELARLELMATLEEKVIQRTQLLDERSHELRLQRDYVSTLLDVVPEGLVVIDQQGEIERINQHAALKMALPFGSKNNLFDCIPDNQQDVLRHCMEDILHLGRATCEVTLTQGEVSHNLLFAGTLAARQPSVKIVMALIDISAQKEAEAANRAKSRFLAGLGHDLRQPANALGIYLSVLQARVEGQDLKALVAKAIDCRATLAYVFDSLLFMARIDSNNLLPQPHPVALQSVWDRLMHTFEPQAQEKGLRLKMVPTELVVSTDAFMLERLLSNLVANAIRYTQSGSVTVIARQRQGVVSVGVTDTGVGIPAGVRQHIFDDFYQVNKSTDEHHGVGLGLSIVSGLARLLKLQHRVFSIPGRGTTFLLQGLISNDDRE
ncbi:sensor histidine kinase [Parvibium lacunae]|uniref:ATP-binding protein n=1 Tax=Parvibium lacunae TaxID=1888893 RepID=UPI001314E0FD|nr:sensor histidine kinase [Parvibium lacunae]